MSDIRSNPCFACPYRKDVPSGIWDELEYDKLPGYDQETPNQPFEPFGCHASPEQLCHGWASCHSNRGHEYQLMALRLLQIDPASIHPSRIKLFGSGREAADHGKMDILKPRAGAKRMITRLIKTYSRLRKSNG